MANGPRVSLAILNGRSRLAEGWRDQFDNNGNSPESRTRVAMAAHGSPAIAGRHKSFTPISSMVRRQALSARLQVFMTASVVVFWSAAISANVLSAA